MHWKATGRVSKKKRRQNAPAPRRRQQQEQSTSLVLPVLVMLILVVVIVVVIISFENRSATPSIASIPTAIAQPTQSIPYPHVPRISIEETQQRVVAGDAQILDVRSASSYQQSHITGAISAPETALEEWIDQVPRDVELVLY